MLKTFFLSPLAGAACGVLGWLLAIGFENVMGAEAFADIQYGWEGAVVGGVAIAVLTMIAVAGDSVDRVIITLFAAIFAGLLWEQRSVPFDAFNVSDELARSYWFTVSSLVIILFLLLTGLRAARESNNRARG